MFEFKGSCRGSDWWFCPIRRDYSGDYVGYVRKDIPWEDRNKRENLDGKSQIPAYHSKVRRGTVGDEGHMKSVLRVAIISQLY